MRFATSNATRTAVTMTCAGIRGVSIGPISFHTTCSKGAEVAENKAPRKQLWGSQRNAGDFHGDFHGDFLEFPVGRTDPSRRSAYISFSLESCRIGVETSFVGSLVGTGETVQNSAVIQGWDSRSVYPPRERCIQRWITKRLSQSLVPANLGR